jgi:hypothetical protein
MTTQFDFGDGCGPVPAHRHRNPNSIKGGWVADTAYVAPTAHIYPNARVGGNAWVTDYARVGGTARIVSRNDLIVITGLGESGTVTAYRTATGYEIRAGCWTGTLDEMKANLRTPEKHWPDADEATRAQYVAEYRALRKLLKLRIDTWTAEGSGS